MRRALTKQLLEDHPSIEKRSRKRRDNNERPKYQNVCVSSSSGLIRFLHLAAPHIAVPAWGAFILLPLSTEMAERSSLTKSRIEHCLVLLVRDCVFLEQLHVQKNVIQCRNGQSQSESEQSKPKGRFTGERLLRERPRVYRRVVELLAEPGTSINQITKLCRVSEHTVRAVREREAVSIAERKQRLISLFGNVAEMSAERMEQLCGKATLRDAGVSAGIATDKLLALLGETGGGLPVQINMYTGVALVQQSPRTRRTGSQ
jgi:hypothetical protein